MLNGLDLFSGIGGLTLALSGYASPMAYCEIDRYAQAILLSRMRAGQIPYAPICDDIKTLKGSMLPPIDIIWGGFPCQDVSSAGTRKGLDGKRSSLFREAIRLVRECRPKFVFFENVLGVRKYVPIVRQELEEIGYDCRDGFLAASDVGAPHIRQRWWLLAYANSDRGRLQQINQQQEPSRVFNNASQTTTWIDVKPPICGMVHGIRGRVDRIRGLGNAVVPLQAKEAFKILMGL